MRREVVAGVVLLVIVAGFWAQRDFNGNLEAAFPEFVLLSLSLLAVAIIVRGILAGTQSVPAERHVDLRYLAAAITLMLGWAVGMGAIGFTISGVLGFIVMAQLIRRGGLRPRPVAMDSAIAVVVVVGVFFIFTRGLLVPLPVSVLIGM